MEEQWIIDLRNFICEPPDPSEFIEVPVPGVSATKGTYWITNGSESRMIIGDIPKGWWKGRGKVLSNKGKKKCLKHLKENNPNAKKYKIVYRDGTEEIVHQLSTWARNNGHKYNNIKAIVHRTKYKKEKQFECYNSPTYHIKEIVPL